MECGCLRKPAARAEPGSTSGQRADPEDVSGSEVLEWSGRGGSWKTGPPGTERADCGTAPPHADGDHPDDGSRRRVKVGQPGRTQEGLASTGRRGPQKDRCFE